MLVQFQRVCVCLLSYIFLQKVGHSSCEEQNRSLCQKVAGTKHIAVEHQSQSWTSLLSHLQRGQHSKKERGQYPAILTPRLVNNQYIVTVFLQYVSSFACNSMSAIINFRLTYFSVIGKIGTLPFFFQDLGVKILTCNLVPRAHVPIGQHQDTELWNN